MSTKKVFAKDVRKGDFVQKLAWFPNGIPESMNSKDAFHEILSHEFVTIGDGLINVRIRLAPLNVYCNGISTLTCRSQESFYVWEDEPVDVILNAQDVSVGDYVCRMWYSDDTKPEDISKYYKVLRRRHANGYVAFDLLDPQGRTLSGQYSNSEKFFVWDKPVKSDLEIKIENLEASVKELKKLLKESEQVSHPVEQLDVKLKDLRVGDMMKTVTKPKKVTEVGVFYRLEGELIAHNRPANAAVTVWREHAEDR